MPMRPPRSALGAALRSWRYDRYRTRLKDKQKPTLEPSHHRRRRRRRGAALRSRAGSRSRGRVADPRAGHRAGQHHLSRELRRAGASGARRHGRRDRGARPGGDGKARHGRAARRRPGLGPRGADADPQVERRRRGRPAGRLRRQGRDLRHRRHLDQAGRRHGSDEVGHGRRRRGRSARSRRSPCARPRPMSSASAAWSRTCRPATPSGRATWSRPCRARRSR